MSLDKFVKMYLDFVNNFLTVEAFADYYHLDVERARLLVELGRMVSNLDMEPCANPAPVKPLITIIKEGYNVADIIVSGLPISFDAQIVDYDTDECDDENDIFKIDTYDVDGVVTNEPIEAAGHETTAHHENQGFLIRPREILETLRKRSAQ